MTGTTVNICFHGVGTPARQLEPGEAEYWISRAAFEDILDVVAERPEVRLSFDDGNASDLEHGLEALLARGLTASFFVLAGRLGKAGSLDAAAVGELQRHGMLIGSHGMDHRPWRGLDPAGRHRELVEARQVLAEVTGSTVDEVALPLGRYDRRLLGDLRRLGYIAVHTSDRRLARRGAWVQPRFSVHSSDSGASVRDAILSPMSLRRRAVRGAAGLAKRLR